MKPSPVPLFNYRKRERQALVSDPQKSSKPNVSGEDGLVMAPTVAVNKPTASSFATLAKFNESSFKISTEVNKNPKPFPYGRSQPVPGSTWSMTNNKATSSSKVKPHSVPKVPALMNHQAGVNNRRVNLDNCSSDRGGKVNVPNGMNQTVSSNLRGTNAARDSQRGRGRRGWQSGGGGGAAIGGSTRGGRDHYNSAREGHYGQFSSSFSSSDHDVSSGYDMLAGPSSSSSSSLYPRQRNTPSPNIRKHQNNYGQSKNNLLKTQSGNVTTHFGIKNNLSKDNSSSRMHSTLAQGREYSTSSDQSTPMNTSFSIFDEEDVIQSHLNQAASFDPLDTSLRFFTCPIKDLLSWSEAGLYEGPVLFEVYGLIMSGPTTINSGLGKEFYLRDQTATLRCVFFEIDRELPNVLKGQVHRIIGSFGRSGGGGYLKVMSIRKADKEERQTCQDATEISLKEMDRLACQLDKEQ